MTPAKPPPAPPLGLVAALTIGFETVTERLELMLLPLILDLFLWWGPRLSIQPVFAQLLAAMADITRSDPQAAQSFEQIRSMFEGGAERFNLFSLLSTTPLGLPSLLAGRGALWLPTGAPPLIAIREASTVSLFWAVFSLAGLWLGALYFGGIAQQVRDGRLSFSLLARQVWGDWARFTALGVSALLLTVVVGLPTTLVIALATAVHQVLGGVVLLVVWSVALWVVLYLSFVPHGLVLRRRNLLTAIGDSVRLVHRNASATLGLYLVTTVLALGLTGIWNLPPDDSWFLLIGLAGHAFVATGLVTTTFVFYQDRYRWWLENQPAPNANPLP